MKKKIFAALAAAAMLCSFLAAPASAAETYKMGDVNMDGTVDLTDAMLVLEEYVLVVLTDYETGVLTEEQCKLATLAPKAVQKAPEEKSQYLYCANMILTYYTFGLIDPTVSETDPAEWIELHYAD